MKIKGDEITINYGETQMMQKIVDRFDDGLRSSPEFVAIRSRWDKGSPVEDETPKKPDQLQVHFTIDDPVPKKLMKCLSRWSPLLRPPIPVSTELKKYSKGSKVVVYSATYNKFLEGTVVMLLPEYDAVKVTYGNGEFTKSVSVKSGLIKLIDEYVLENQMESQNTGHDPNSPPLTVEGN
ncbi:hypothetical protein RFI_23934 [Reticulomyxa filosa]|uniref:Uncharacterized protein n=1 Tax=Reticulomyxa filosa TaxID=46433 RepID=X6MJ44_RETFI|nr:hypothetical protein RFI_23934 [Reticulomyxa filosa]|eukprot:ETO13442.1 hypothetical protein RFI_23934 [Reticulomyxa filosa]